MIKLNFNKKVFFTYIYYISHNFTHSITIYKDLRLKNFIDILYYFFQLKKERWARPILGPFDPSPRYVKKRDFKKKNSNKG